MAQVGAGQQQPAALQTAGNGTLELKPEEERLKAECEGWRAKCMAIETEIKACEDDLSSVRDAEMLANQLSREVVDYQRKIQDMEQKILMAKVTNTDLIAQGKKLEEQDKVNAAAERVLQDIHRQCSEFEGKVLSAQAEQLKKHMVFSELSAAPDKVLHIPNSAVLLAPTVYQPAPQSFNVFRSVQSADPLGSFSNNPFLTPDIHQTYPSSQPSRGTGGIGITLAAFPADSQFAGRYHVSRVEKFGSAQLAGVGIDDILITADGQDMLGFDISAIASRFQGPEGTTLNLEFLRLLPTGQYHKYAVALIRQRT